MKKLTPFQKKLARWHGGYRIVRWAENIAFLILIISAAIFAVNRRDIFLAIMAFCAGAIVIAFAVSRVGSVEIKSFWSQLPETQAEKAKEFIEANPKYAKRIDELIQEAFEQDEGGDLQEAMEKFKILAGKEKSLADLPNQVEELKQQIAALEKELGL